MTAWQRWYFRLAAAGLCGVLGACGPSKSESQGQPLPTPPPPPPPAASYLPPDTPRPLVEAQQFLQDAPACRVETIVVYSRSPEKYLYRTDFVRGGAIWVWEQHGNSPQLDLITDGAREFVSYQGKYMEEHGDAAGIFALHWKDDSLAGLIEDAGKITTADEETVDGMKALVFVVLEHRDRTIRSRGKTQEQYIDSVTKVWLAADNHRPLKTEAVTRGMIQSNATTTFTFDPSLKVELPETR